MSRSFIYENNYDYIPELPHLEKWSKGIKIKNMKGLKGKESCLDYQKEINKKKGPKKGFDITLKGLPSSKGKSVLIRFWAAKPDEEWEDFQSAYEEMESDYEEMPVPGYSNAGMVKVNAAGIAKFSLEMPIGYKSKKDGKKIPPHFHYRICINGKMGPVHTQFLKKNENIPVHT